MAQLKKRLPAFTQVKEGWGMTEVAGGFTGGMMGVIIEGHCYDDAGVNRTYGDIKMGSCGQVRCNARLQVNN